MFVSIPLIQFAGLLKQLDARMRELDSRLRELEAKTAVESGADPEPHDVPTS